MSAEIFAELLEMQKQAGKRISQKMVVSVMTELEEKLKIGPNEHIVQTVHGLHEARDALQAAVLYSVDTETTGLHVRTSKRDQILGIGVATLEHSWYIPLFHAVREAQVPIELVREALNPIFADPTKTCVLHNTSFDWHVLETAGFIRPVTVEDTSTASHVLEENDSHRLKDLIEKYLDYHESAPFNQLFKKLSFATVPLHLSGAYAVKDPKMTLQLWQFQRPYLATLGRLDQVYQLEKDVLPVVYAMERKGFRIDLNYMNEVKEKVGKIEEETIAAFDERFPGVNPRSPKQLQQVLYQDMGLKPLDKKMSTDRKTLLRYLPQAPDLQLILDVRDNHKLLSTYVDGLMAEAVDSRIHARFNPLGAETGRFSSSDPNLQNIPAKHGSMIRGAFLPDPGYKLISVDYSQVELRILAHFSQDVSMLDAYRTGKDLHTATASDMFGIPFDQVDPNGPERKRAKTLNFGIIYGQTEYGLSDGLGVSKEEAASILDRFFAARPGLAHWLDQIVREAAAKGYVETIYGRKRRLRALREKTMKDPEWHHAARQAKNAPIQGSSADITKLALVACYNDPQLRAWGVDILSTVHDEIIFQAPEAVVDQAAERAKTLMENVIQLSVPLVCDVEIMDRWH